MPCHICSSKKTAYFAQKDIYTFYRCSTCKTIFLPSCPSQKQLNGYYAKQLSYESGLRNEAVIRYRSRIILKNIRQLAPVAKTICDVGSSYGFFLDEAQKNGYKVVGIEPAKQLAIHAKKNYLVFTFTGELENYIDVHHKVFDVVTCIHVIEHVSDPKEFVTLLLRLVKPGGLLIIETPNSDSHLLYAEREQYTFLLPPDHLWLFSKESMEHLLPKNTETIFVSTYSYSEHFMGIVKALFRTTTPKKSASGVKTKIEEHKTNEQIKKVRKKLFYYLFDRTLAPLFTSLLNLYHKGSILELYIRNK